ncbi:unnamed protein product, partial [Vitis vinifera]
MGCASSKQPRCRHCQNSFAPVPRSYSMHVHHPPQSKGDSYHVVALTSTTLGTLKLDTSHQNRNSHVNGTIVEEEEDKENKPETINAWELMEGLEDASPLRSPNHLRSFSFDIDRRPMWLNLVDSEMNPNSNSKTASQSFAKDTVVVYFTSLRGVRKTYEDCCHVRVILKSLGIRLDERDVSMHSGFKEELKDLLGDAFNSGSLPRVFLGRRYIGGAEDVRRMHEEGQLEKTLEDSEKTEAGGNSGSRTCEACGDIRFVPCETCSGSCKIYYEGDEEDDDEEGEFGFQRCPDCNENGLIRCPICCY